MPLPKILRAVACACVLAAAQSAAAQTVQADVSDTLRVTKLPNGLTVLTLEDKSKALATFQVFVRAGSADETRWTGIAHLFEHMMFRGSKHLAQDEYDRVIEGRGGRINAYTTRDFTAYFADVPAEHLPVVIALEAERFRNLRVDEASLASEREVVISERRYRTEDQARGRAFEQLFATVFKAHPYRRPVIGWLSDLQKVDVAACTDFFNKYYAADNLIIVVAGDFESEATLAQIRKHFGPLRSAGALQRNPTAEPQQRGPRRAGVHFEVASPLLQMAWRAPPTGAADAEALDVLSYVLAEGRASRLYRRLVYQQNAPALSAQSAYWEFAEAGLFFTEVQVRPGQSVARAERQLLEEIARLRKTPPAPHEVERARRKLEVRLVDGQDSIYAIAQRIGTDWLHFGRVRPLHERIAKIRGVTPADVQRVAQKYLAPVGRNTVIVRAQTPQIKIGGKAN